MLLDYPLLYQIMPFLFYKLYIYKNNIIINSKLINTSNTLGSCLIVQMLINIKYCDLNLTQEKYEK